MRRFYYFIAFPFLGADQGQCDGLGGRGGLLQVMMMMMMMMMMVMMMMMMCIHVAAGVVASADCGSWGGLGR